eukprot:1157477-Pelagomonas_calceolata.AAC.2
MHKLCHADTYRTQPQPLSGTAYEFESGTFMSKSGYVQGHGFLKQTRQQLPTLRACAAAAAAAAAAASANCDAHSLQEPLWTILFAPSFELQAILHGVLGEV